MNGVTGKHAVVIVGVWPNGTAIELKEIWYVNKMEHKTRNDREREMPAQILLLLLFDVTVS